MILALHHNCKFYPRSIIILPLKISNRSINNQEVVEHCYCMKVRGPGLHFHPSGRCVVPRTGVQLEAKRQVPLIGCGALASQLALGVQSLPIK